MPFKVDEIADLLGKFANARLQEDEDSPVFVDDFVEQIIGDMDIDDLNKEEIAARTINELRACVLPELEDLPEVEESNTLN